MCLLLPSVWWWSEASREGILSNRGGKRKHYYYCSSLCGGRCQFIEFTSLLYPLLQPKSWSLWSWQLSQVSVSCEGYCFHLLVIMLSISSYAVGSVYGDHNISTTIYSTSLSLYGLLLLQRKHLWGHPIKSNHVKKKNTNVKKSFSSTLQAAIYSWLSISHFQPCTRSIFAWE